MPTLEDASIPLSRTALPRRRFAATGLRAAACVFLLTGPAAAQPPAAPAPPSPLTLDAALTYAAEHYPSLRAAVEEVNAATANVSAARTSYLPRLDGVWQSNRGTVNNITGPLLPQSVLSPISGPPLPSTSAQSVWGSAAGALLSWEPFDLGLRWATVQEAEAAVLRARAGQGLTRLQVQQAVGAAYLATVAARQAAVAADADLARRDALARAARALVQAELRPGAEAARADAERAAAQTRVIQARQSIVIAEALLTRLLGADQTPVLPALQSLLAPVPPERPAVEPVEPTHPLLQVQQAVVDVARARDTVLASSFRPRFLLQGSTVARGSGALSDGRLEGGANGLWLDRVNWTAGLQIVFPNLFDVVGIRARRQAAAATARAEVARLDEQRLALTADQRSAEALVQGAREIARNMLVQLDAARTSEVQARARFDAGLASIVEVADSQALLATTEYQDAAAQVDVWRALLAQAIATDGIDRFIALARGQE